MDQLPAEMLHLVCESLGKKEDVHNFRLVCKAFADIGAAHLLRQIHFFLHPDAATKAMQIAEHRIISRRITSLFYEAGNLPGVPMNYTDWVDGVSDQWNEREHLSELIDVNTLRPVNNDRSMARYQKYRYVANWIEHIVEDERDYKFLSELMSQLPSLKRIYMSSSSRLVRRTKKIEQAYSDYPDAFDSPRDRDDFRYGLRELQSALFAAGDAKLRLERVHAGEVLWKFVGDEPSLLRYIEPCKTLTSLRLMFHTSWDETGNELGADSVECRGQLRSGAFRRFVTSLPDLQTLQVVFNGDSNLYGFPADLTNVVGNMTWRDLKTLGLTLMSTDQQLLLDVVERHAKTLERLELVDMGLTTGSWADTLRKIRPMTSLRRALICGYLKGPGEPGGQPETWNIATPDIGRDTLRSELRVYLVDKSFEGDCPLAKSPDSEDSDDDMDDQDHFDAFCDYLDEMEDDDGWEDEGSYTTDSDLEDDEDDEEDDDSILSDDPGSP